MSRTLFILGCALLAVAGSLVFVIRQHDDPASAAAADASPRIRDRASRTSGEERFGNHSPRASQRAEATGRTEVAIEPARLARLAPGDRQEAAALLDQIERDSRDRLDQLDARYRLTPAQRRDIYPHVVAQHPLAHPALEVGGRPIPALETAKLEESIFPYLDEEQQQQVADAAIDEMNWWSEIIGQIEDDLDRSLDQGIPGDGSAVADPAIDPAVTEDPDGPAPGDGELSDHGGTNLFDLLGQ
jgi:hypothetical protein